MVRKLQTRGELSPCALALAHPGYIRYITHDNSAATVETLQVSKKNRYLSQSERFFINIVVKRVLIEGGGITEIFRTHERSESMIGVTKPFGEDKVTVT